MSIIALCQYSSDARSASVFKCEGGRYDLLDAGDCVTPTGANASDAWCLPSVHIIGAMKGSTNELSTWLAENPLLEKPPHEVPGRTAGGL